MWPRSASPRWQHPSWSTKLRSTSAKTTQFLRGRFVKSWLMKVELYFHYNSSICSLYVTLCFKILGICPAETAPSVSSINRILRAKAAERANEEIAQFFARCRPRFLPAPPPPNFLQLNIPGFIPGPQLAPQMVAKRPVPVFPGFAMDDSRKTRNLDTCPKNGVSREQVTYNVENRNHSNLLN